MKFNYPEIPDIKDIKIEVPELPMQHNQKEREEPKTWFAKVARLTSWVLVPLLMPVYGIIMVFTLSILAVAPLPSRLMATGMIIVFNLLIPALLIYLLKFLGVVKDVALNQQNERLIPYIITMIAYGSSALYLWHAGCPQWVYMFYIGGAVAAIINSIVNIWWKISAHAAAAAGLVAMLASLIRVGIPVHTMGGWLLGAVLATGFLGTCRVYLYRHTPLQVMAGYAVGFCSVYFLCMI